MHKNIMATLLVMLLLPLVATLAESDVFTTGNYTPIAFPVKASSVSNCSPPKSLWIVRPEEKGEYPVILFHHGTELHNSWYTDLFEFISSHGHIVVAPQLYEDVPPSGQEEINWAAEVANWLPSCLQSALHSENVHGNLSNLALAGHSRGGYVAFALALGKTSDNVHLQVNFTALVGVDPVEVIGNLLWPAPKILNDTHCSWDLKMPVTIIGTRLGKLCHPSGISHEAFFNDCKPPCSHFVTANYGHLDMLDDWIAKILGPIICGEYSPVKRDPMRRTVGGIIVSFLEAFFQGNFTDYDQILQKPSAPARLDPVQNKTCATSSTTVSSTLSDEL